MPRIKKALISVYNKHGILEFARSLTVLGIEIISTGGTARHLGENGIATGSISEITGFPEILDGRVKTLHPKIFGGLLSRRESDSHLSQLNAHDIALIDLLVVNLYPFAETIAQQGVSLEEALENIDIGGPALIRAAAKNYPAVTVVTSSERYGEIAEELAASDGEVSLETRKSLATEAFQLTSAYDRLIAGYLAGPEPEKPGFPGHLTLDLEKVQDLRYGENPHQPGALYRDAGPRRGVLKSEQLHGKELSFNNMIDLDAAMGAVREFEEPCAVVIKHTNPCGLAIGETLAEAYMRARESDPLSAFGGILGLNRTVDADTAGSIAEVFMEAIIAPGYEPEALEILQRKKNLRLLINDLQESREEVSWDMKRVEGGLLVQRSDGHTLDHCKFDVVSHRQPSEDEWRALRFAWRVVKWVKSNAIVFSTQDRTVGIGAGQMSRVDSVKIAVNKAKELDHSLTGTVLASDAFFPFRDGLEAAAQAGATAVIQPGGSIRDDEVIAAADDLKLAMVLTGIRHFRH